MLISRRSFAAGLAAAAAWLPDHLKALPAHPKLFVIIISEQFRQVYLERAEGGLDSGGFRRLIEQGAYFPNCRLASSGFSATGLASLVTGAYPQLHGIIADQWYDRTSSAPVKARTEMLQAGVLAAEIARLGKRARVYCLGLDEELTGLMAGHASAQTLWMDGRGQFTTRGNAPEWLAAHNRLNPIENLHNAKWMAMGAGTGVPPLRTLSYDPKRPEEFFMLYRASPYGQAAQFELLRRALSDEKLGQGDTLDFVFVALGSMALLGYETGSDSPLMNQMVLQLDRQLQGTIEKLNDAPGVGNYNLVFTAAHGAPAEPPSHARTGRAIAGEALAQGINRALSDWIDKQPVRNKYVEKYVYPFLYLKVDNLRKQGIGIRVARRLAGELALRQPGVAGYYTADGDCSHSGEWRQRFENSFHALRSGDVMLSYEPGDVEEYGTGHGISYGSLYNYDTRVPLFLYGTQFAAQVIERPVESIDLAPTLARAAGVSPPSSSTGEVLADAFAEAT